MTIFIVKENNPDLVKRYDDVLSVEVEKEKKELQLTYVDFKKGALVLAVEKGVISIESN
jgi:hypothetical protein